MGRDLFRCVCVCFLFFFLLPWSNGDQEPAPPLEALLTTKVLHFMEALVSLFFPPSFLVVSMVRGGKALRLGNLGPRATWHLGSGSPI